MRHQSNNNQNESRFNVDSLTSFYNENKRIINGIGIAAVAGAAVYSAVRWVPFQDWYSKIEETYNEHFADREFNNSVSQPS